MQIGISFYLSNQDSLISSMFTTRLASLYKAGTVSVNYFQRYSKRYVTSIKSINLAEPSVQKYLNHLMIENEMLLVKDKRDPLEVERLKKLRSIVSVLAQRMYLEKSVASLKDEHTYEEDQHVRKMVQEELEIYRKRVKETDTQLQSVLLEPPLSRSKILVEVVAAEGDGAMLFTKELFHLYKAYAKYKDWSCDVATMEESANGFKRASIFMEGVGVREMMNFENGVHYRIADEVEIDRISTACVSILVLPKKIEMDVPGSELIVETKEASDADGDSKSYVCITHTPTKTSVKCKANKSNKLNKHVAMRELITLVFNNDRLSTKEQKDEEGLIQSDKIIRTYDHSRDRVMEHRKGADSQHRLISFMEGGEPLERLQESLLQHHHYQTLIKEISKFDQKQKVNDDEVSTSR